MKNLILIGFALYMGLIGQAAKAADYHANLGLIAASQSDSHRTGGHDGGGARESKAKSYLTFNPKKVLKTGIDPVGI